MNATFATVISLGSLVIAIVSAFFAWRSAKAAARSVILTQEQQFEYWVSLVARRIDEKLPTNDVAHAAGLPVANLIDALPESLLPRRKEIIKLGYHRALSGGYPFFWIHLCEIKKWDTETGTSKNQS